MRCYCTPLSTGLRAALHPRIGHLVHFWHASFLLGMFLAPHERAHNLWPALIHYCTPPHPPLTRPLSYLPSSASRVLARLRYGRDTRRSRQELGGGFGKPDRVGRVAQALGRVYKGLQEGARRREACRVRRTAQGVCVCFVRFVFTPLRLIVSNMYTAPH